MARRSIRTYAGTSVAVAKSYVSAQRVSSATNHDLCEKLKKSLDMYEDLLNMYQEDNADKLLEGQELAALDVQRVIFITREIRATAKTLADLRNPEVNLFKVAEEVLRTFLAVFASTFTDKVLTSLKERLKTYMRDEVVLNAVMQGHLRVTGEAMREALTSANERMTKLVSSKR